MYYISKDKADLQFGEVMNLMKQTYWAKRRSEETIRCSIENSLCYGAYLKDGGRQVAFARVITDYATTFYICDVIVSEECRGMGIGKKLIETIVDDERIKGLRGLLLTKDAHGLYQKYGFVSDGERFMGRNPQ